MKNNTWKYLFFTLIAVILLGVVYLITIDKKITTESIVTNLNNRPVQADSENMTDTEIFEEDMSEKMANIKEGYKTDLSNLKADLLSAISKGNIELVEQEKTRREKEEKEASYPPSPTFDIPKSEANEKENLPFTEAISPLKTLSQTRVTRVNNEKGKNNVDRFIVISGSVHLTQEKNDLGDEIIVKSSTGKITKTIKKKTAIKIPPSFMEGTLLAGLMAKTVSGASDNPDQLFIRIQAPAFLPNYVRANTTGCFVVAQGTGDLASHRIKTRLISLSCIDNSGRRLVHGKIYGFLADADDGVSHISGVVVHKGGAIISQAILADTVSALGGGIAELSKPTLSSSNGILSSDSIGGKDLLQGSIGSGIKAGSKVYSGMLKQLISQATPVITVGNTKNVVVFITKPSDLEIYPLVKEEEEKIL